MGRYDNIGELMHLPLESIEPSEKSFSESEFILNAAAEAVLQAEGRNWIPLIVKEINPYQYRVVANPFIYAVAHQAHLERVWCIVIPSDDKSVEQAKILAREIPPKVNLNNASGDMILTALQYLLAEPKSPLKGVDAIIAANRISSAEDRETWTDYKAIPKLKCRITEKKVEELARVFFLSPSMPDPPPPPPPVMINIKRASRKEIFERLDYLSTHKIGGFEAIATEQASDIIFSANKSKWRSLNPIEKLNIGIDKKKIIVLKTLFTVSSTDDKCKK